MPFELGAAYKGGKGIGTYLVDYIATPEYLDTFPKMRGRSDLEKFVELYRDDQKHKSLSNSRSIRLDESEGQVSADNFIRRLKSTLGQ